MPESRDVLRLHIPVDGLTPKQRKRAVELGNKVEAAVAGMIAKGANPDRLMTWVENHFLGE